jgi:hypothetical protein
LKEFVYLNIKLNGKRKKMSLHFATFANTGSRFDTTRICREACKLIDSSRVNAYNETVPELEKHSQFISSNKRGFGYWIWKPFVVLDAFKKMELGDLLLYCDAGCSINEGGVTRFQEYIKLVQSSESGILSFQMPHLERNYCKKSLLTYLSAESLSETGQYVGGIFFIRKSEENIALVEKWKDIASLYWTIDDSPSKESNTREFVEHRHDQAVWSILRKCAKPSIVLNDETWGDFNSEDMKTKPIWASRIGT